METYKKFKVIQNVLRFYIFASGIGFTFYVGLLCFGVRHSLAEWIAMTFGYALMAGGVWMFRLCLLSWAFVTYGYAVRTCIILHRENVFGEYIDLAHYVMFSIGLTLTIILLFNIKRLFYETDKPQTNRADAAPDGRQD